MVVFLRWLYIYGVYLHCVKFVMAISCLGETLHSEYATLAVLEIKMDFEKIHYNNKDIHILTEKSAHATV